MTKTFTTNPIPLPKLTRIDGEQRFYETPTGEKYPSVTTVLSGTSDKSFLFRWRKRVGADEANRITQRSASRGRSVHSLCENFVLNKPIDLSTQMPFNVHLFNQIKSVLNSHVDDIRVSEGSLFSHKLKIAGSVDLVASYKNRPAIVDFKTSLKNKREEWVTDYFLQASMYSFMLWEMTGVLHPNIVIIIAVEEEDKAQVFETVASKWLPLAKQRCLQFHSINSVGVT